MYNWETFQAAYQVASKEDKAVIDSDTIPACVREVVESKRLDNSHQGNLVRLYALFRLKAITEQDLIEEMKKLGIPESKMVFDALQTCLEDKQAISIVQSDQVSEIKNLATDIAEAEAAIGNLSNVRTMAKDMADSQAAGEMTHSSTQEAILSEKDTIRPSQNNRWGSSTD